MMDRIEDHVAFRRLQIADLVIMQRDGHTGAADAIARIRAELRMLGVVDEPAVPAGGSTGAPEAVESPASPA